MTAACQSGAGTLTVDVIIPALDEVESIASVIGAIPRELVRTVVVVDNGSLDGTGEAALGAGAQVVREPRRGYGRACLAGLAALPAAGDVVVFLDADGSDDPGLLPALLAPIEAGLADLVVGARTADAAEPSALTVPQRVGNALAASWLRRRFGVAATDLGPFRAIRRTALELLRMSDPTYGWTVEMQLKAAAVGLRYREVRVPARPRTAGRSKVSGTVRGTMGAAVKILGLLAWHDLSTPRR